VLLIPVQGAAAGAGMQPSWHELCSLSVEPLSQLAMLACQELSAHCDLLRDFGAACEAQGEVRAVLRRPSHVDEGRWATLCAAAPRWPRRWYP
jgi:hypothetical protein